ncbi:hypothetical protein QU487_07045 [Crenobacter sp. SG2305]|uniref:hypothetical protein n=1 Tax=Crenobacter oryzisoli TaxID=3056844 RepID=UPI0025AAE4F1|nr:hypothetical protein [Crenobacter sp. SG2305]MDN0082512.1 hypothetical protein [Crenobacter sp. SG2305]
MTIKQFFTALTASIASGVMAAGLTAIAAPAAALLVPAAIGVMGVKVALTR